MIDFPLAIDLLGHSCVQIVGWLVVLALTFGVVAGSGERSRS